LVLGDAFYALYLTHLIAVETLRPLVDMTHSLAGMIAALGVSVAVAIMVHFKVERPMLAALRRLAIKRAAAAESVA
jgi:peptidoglycan/LPS O-acetylase OafA/YrhL